MKTASPQLFVPIKENDIKDYFATNINERKDTNIGLLNFNFISTNLDDCLPSEELILCKNCGAALNFHSKIQEQTEEKQKSLWVCEFCYCENFIEIRENEKIKKADPLYLLHREKKEAEYKSESIFHSDEKPEFKKEDDDEPTMIFCLDTSGSMCMKAGKNNMSRTKCVVSAVRSSLNELFKNHPNRKVGVVTFNNEITVIGDGFDKNKQFANNLDFNTYLVSGKLAFETNMKHSLNESFPNILKCLDKIEENGSTALGPALLLSAGMAGQASNGASIILCTDGLANRGLGALWGDNDSEKAREFYRRVADFANEHGIMINITTIKGDECKIDVLGDLTDRTDGRITRVDPNDLEQNFQNIIKEEILANKVEIKLYLHKALILRKMYDDEFKFIDGNYYKKIMGNITLKSELIFEYDLKPDNDESKLNYYSQEMKGFPIQTQISFQTKHGSFLKVFTIFQQISNEKEEVEKKAYIPIIQKTATIKTCSFAMKSRKIFDSGEYYKIAEKASSNNLNEGKEQLEEFKKEANNLENILSQKKTESCTINKKFPMANNKNKKIFDSADCLMHKKSLQEEESWAPPMQSIPERLSQDFEMNDELAMKLMNIKNRTNENDKI